MGRFVENMLCKLSEDEVNSRSSELARKIGEMTVFQESAKAAKAELSKEEKNRDTEIRRLAQEIHTKSADKPVDCYDEPDNARFIYRIIRADTGEEIRTRPMDAEERNLARQGRLFGTDESDEEEGAQH